MLQYCPHLVFDNMTYENLKAAAENDSTDSLYAQIQVDPYALERIDAVPFIHTPLHIAAAAGKISFATEIFRLKPSFALKLNENGSSPMHLALENPEPGIVRRLVKLNKDVIRVKGKDGLTPLHLVSTDEKVELLAEFLSACPESIEDVTVQSETALHVAVKNGQFDALKVLLGWLFSNCKKGASDVQNSVLNWEDKDGNTILHILVGQDNYANLQMVQWLIHGKINLNAKNSRGSTALDIVKDKDQNDANIVRIKNLLLGAKALSGDSVPSAPTLAETLVKVNPGNCLRNTRIAINRFRDGLSNDTRNILLVVAVLVATSTNQAALSPPGGVYQSEADNLNNTSIITRETKVPGTSVMDVVSFHVFWAYNSVALLVSALAIYILMPPVGGFTRLVTFPLSYFVVGFFFSLSVIGPPFTIGYVLYSQVIIIGVLVTFTFLLKLGFKSLFGRRNREMTSSGSGNRWVRWVQALL
ncbi:hypothetical protein L6164_001316 [Bauhinia variegata]|uniref:Uncharacterized protein n=1 Tax=Bauhinia variegata TaxID=167791 RepID=A0ACB9Q9G3_BAUVA|nr:hypothetical protein L6164_001316 [Bauhinia variegata]